MQVPLELLVPVGEQQGCPEAPQALQVYVAGETAALTVQVFAAAEQKR